MGRRCLDSNYKPIRACSLSCCDFLSVSSWNEEKAEDCVWRDVLAFVVNTVRPHEGWNGCTSMRYAIIIYPPRTKYIAFIFILKVKFSLRLSCILEVELYTYNFLRLTTASGWNCYQYYKHRQSTFHHPISLKCFGTVHALKKSQNLWDKRLQFLSSPQKRLLLQLICQLDEPDVILKA